MKLPKLLASSILLLFAQLVFAQLPADIKNVKVDEMTDAQIKQYIIESEKSGIPEAQQESLALKNGMPPAELQKLKDRVALIRSNNATKGSSGKASEPKSADNVLPEEKVIQVENKPATPDVPPTAPPTDPTKIYGHHLFRDNNLQFFEKASDVKAPDSYIIGANDELTVSVFGFSYFNEVLKVDGRGAINPSNIGSIMIKGLEFGKAKSLIRSKFSQSFDLSNNQLTITLSYSRVISVNFVGEVVKPGTYKIPAINSAFNALIAVGGPSDLGSVRNIQVRRGGKTIKVLDVYEYLNNPNSKMDFYLEDNDYIYVSPSFKIVNILGIVKRPMYYELNTKEDLEDLIRLAGGLASNAYTRLIKVVRNGEDGTQKQILNISLDSLNKYKKAFPLKDGDIVEIGAKSNEIRQFVEVSGFVFRPGVYQFIKGDRISDLITKANGLRKEALLDKAFLVRTNPDKSKEYISVDLKTLDGMSKGIKDDLFLKEGDILKIFSVTDFADAKTVSASGLFRKPGSFDYFEGIRLLDIVFIAGGSREEANLERAFLIRTKPDFTKEFLPINIKEASSLPNDSSKNIYLQKGDIVTLASVTDYIDKMNVYAIGLFRKPGSFEYVNGMTVSDLLFLAGGLRMEADLLNIEVSRISFFADEYKPGDASRVIIKTMQAGKDLKLTQDQLDFKLTPFDQVFVRMVPDFELPKNLTINGEVKYPGIYALSKKDERLDEIVKRAGGLNRFAYPEGASLYRPGLSGSYVVMNLKEALRKKNSKYNYILKEGDVLTIPQTLDLIAIRGDVEYLSIQKSQEQVNAPFNQRKRADFYVKEYANGFTETSFKRKVYVLENNNKVNRTRNYIIFKVYPKVKKGSTIYVVSKPEKKKEQRKKSDPIDWNKNISEITTKLTGIATLYILLRTAGVKF